MKLKAKKLPKRKDVCEPEVEYVSRPVPFVGRVKLQVRVTDYCGLWRATLSRPDSLPMPFLVNRKRRSRRPYFRRRGSSVLSLFLEGSGKSKAKALADLDKAVKREVRLMKRLESWVAKHPIVGA